MANNVLLETIELTQSAASITFDNLPSSGYTDLKIVINARCDYAAVVLGLVHRFNGDTTAGNYTGARPYGSGAGHSYDADGGCGFLPGTSTTANVFGQTTLYIPNYNVSGVTKNVITESTQENYATGNNAYMTIQASKWSGTAAITSMQIYSSGGNFVAGSTFSLYGVATVGTTPALAPKATGGNVVSTDGTYWYHTFLTSGTFVPQVNLTCDYLVVAGGGGGGFSAPGGGGAGGLRCTVGATGGGGSLESPLSLTSGNNYAVTIGSGGAFNGFAGSNSTFSTITAIGGGRGSGGSAGAATTGGSGGGGSEGGGNYAGAAGTANQGYAGGSGNGGGGGAGGPGYNGYGAGAGLPNGGVGGPGVTTSISGTSTTYASGGSAYVNNGGPQRSANPSSGGGGGASVSNGAVNTGGGGAADYGAGGSGIVIVRYAMA